MIELLGPCAEPRKWLLHYLRTARFTNPRIQKSLEADWSDYPKEKATYLLGVIWGRLRQADNSLETASEYAQLVEAEFDSTTNQEVTNAYT